MVAEEAIKVKREVVVEQVMVRVGLDTVGELEVMWWWWLVWRGRLWW